MRFFSITTVLAGLASFVAAQTGDTSNPITFPTAGTVLNAGDTIQVKWQPTTQGPVTLTLRFGNSGNLQTGETIALNAPNTGIYSWQVPKSIGSGSYALQIKTSPESTGGNYSPVFQVSGGTGQQTAVSGAASATSRASSASASASSAISSISRSASSAASSASSSASSASSSASASRSASAPATAPSNAASRGSAPGFAAAIGLGALVALA